MNIFSQNNSFETPSFDEVWHDPCRERVQFKHTLFKDAHVRAEYNHFYLNKSERLS
jgi:hypothetical protein